MKYPLAESFKAPQGEGLYTGTQMAFVRLVGCSVGQKVCTACDTDFDRMLPELGGGLYEPEALIESMDKVSHLCVTGGEPLDRDLRPLIAASEHAGKMVHIETSGTVHPDWLDPIPDNSVRPAGRHAIGEPRPDGDALAGFVMWRWVNDLWVTVSPKPGYRPSMIAIADEIKVILGGLGDGPGWPGVADAVRWADEGKLVYVQPRNDRMDIRHDNLQRALEVVAEYPQLRLSTQAHKFVRTR